MSTNYNINLNSLRPDYSSLFSGFGSGSSNSGGISNFLSDYASIKNGSYRKLMKAYYSEAGSEAAKKSSSKTARKGGYTAEDMIADKIKWQRRVETQESKAYTQVKSATDSLTKAIDKLGARGDSSVFAKKDITSIDEEGLERVEYGYDKEAIYKAVSDYVSSYNSVLQAADKAGNYSISNRVTSMQKETKANQEALKQLGVTIKSDNTLSIDKDTFMKADMDKAASLLGSGSSYTRGMSASAAMIKQNANYEQLRANTYTDAGTFDNAYSSGSSYSATL